MKRVKLFMILLLSFGCFAGYAQETDAEILSEKVVREYEFVQERYLSKFIKYEMVYRKVQVNTLYGLQDLNTLYIPTFKQLSYESELVSVEGKVIKSDGSEIKVQKTDMQTTTLPANLESLYGYDGEVLQFAFEGAEVGDVIEYTYRIKYTASKSYGNWEVSSTDVFASKYPIHRCEYVFDLPAKASGMFGMANSNEKVTYEKDKNTYSIILEDVAPFSEEYYAIREQISPFLKYRVSSEKYWYHDNWDSRMRYGFEKAKKKEYFFGGYTIKDLSKALEEKASVMSKIEGLKRLMEDTYLNDAYATYMTYEEYYVDLGDVQQLVRLMDLLEIDVSILFVKDKYDGPLVESYYSISQFSDLFLRFKDENGDWHYWQVFAPFKEVDYISYPYQNTTALNVSRKDKELEISFMKMPAISAANNVRSKVADITVTRTGNNLVFDVEEHIVLSGANAHDEYLMYHLEKADSTISIYSDVLINDYQNRYYNCKVDTVMFNHDSSLNASGLIDYRINYSYKIPFAQQYQGVVMEMKDIIGKDAFDEVGGEISSAAYFDYPYTINAKYFISVDAEKIVSNDYFNVNEANEFAGFTSVADVDGTMMKLDLSYTQSATEISPEEWGQFSEVIKHVFSFYNQVTFFEY